MFQKTGSENMCLVLENVLQWYARKAHSAGFAQGLKVACPVIVSSAPGKKRCSGQPAQGSQPAPVTQGDFCPKHLERGVWFSSVLHRDTDDPQMGCRQGGAFCWKHWWPDGVWHLLLSLDGEEPGWISTNTGLGVQTIHALRIIVLLENQAHV